MRRTSAAEAVTAPGAPSGAVPGASDGWPAWRRSLQYFALSRLVVAAVMLAYVPLMHGAGGLDERFDAALFLPVAIAYLAGAAVFVAASWPERLGRRPLAIVQVAVDVAALGVLIHASGGLRTGLAVLLLLPTAGAAILLGARMGMFFAATSALGLLVETGWRGLGGESVDAAFVQAGLAGAALLATAAIVGLLATRLASQERLAWRRGEDLRHQFAITQAVIGELPEGVVVFDARGAPRALNRAAREMLGDRTGAPAGVRASVPPNPLAAGLADPGAMPGLPVLRAALAASADASRAGTSADTDAIELTVPVSATTVSRLRARRLDVPAGGADTVVVLEDLGRIEAQAQQLKLASMGRLSASIAHEIRNPLSAIRHANGLLAESLQPASLKRLATIVEDNCRRIDRVIEDVLSISRRGRGAPEALDARTFVESAIAEFLAQSGADATRIACRIDDGAPIWFDAGNLRQVLLNLVANALRHASAERGAVRVEWGVDAGTGRRVLTVADDGPGVPQALRAHLFEPFFTTEARGTGLGLHLARELCAANGAAIRYRPACDDPPLRSAFVVEPADAPPRR